MILKLYIVTSSLWEAAFQEHFMEAVQKEFIRIFYCFGTKALWCLALYDVQEKGQTAVKFFQHFAHRFKQLLAMRIYLMSV